MNTAASQSPLARGNGSGRNAKGVKARGLAAMLLTIAVAAVAVLAEPLFGHWTDGQLFAGWLALWAVAFVGTVVLTGSAGRLARHVQGRLEQDTMEAAQARA